MGGITNPGEVPSVLDQHMLKATSSANQRDVPLARFQHDPMRRLWIAVWAAGPNDDCRSSDGDPASATNRVGGYNSDLDGDPTNLRHMSEGGEGRAMVPVIGRQIHQHCDHDSGHR